MRAKIIRYLGTYVAIAMPLPNFIAKDLSCLDEWKSCYGEETAEGKILSEAKHYNAYIIDVCILWSKAEFHFKMYFQSESSAECFIQAITEFIE